MDVNAADEWGKTGGQNGQWAVQAKPARGHLSALIPSFTADAAAAAATLSVLLTLCLPAVHCASAALHMASANGHADIVKTLIDAGAVSRRSCVLMSCCWLPQCPDADPCCRAEWLRTLAWSAAAAAVALMVPSAKGVCLVCAAHAGCWQDAAHTLPTTQPPSSPPANTERGHRQRQRQHGAALGVPDGPGGGGAPAAGGGGVRFGAQQVRGQHRG